MKKIAIILIGLSIINGCASDSTPKEITEPEVVDDIAAETDAVNAVIKAYKDALENLTIENTLELFSDDSQVFESGGNEGTYKNYTEHHLGPELEHFKSFTFSDYTLETTVSLPYAFTTEFYVYTIVLAEDEREIKQKGMATSVLRKEDGKWKIIKTHTSARRFSTEGHGGGH
jgi:uncharacterized protein (TIGR02246 family)